MVQTIYLIKLNISRWIICDNARLIEEFVPQTHIYLIKNQSNVYWWIYKLCFQVGAKGIVCYYDGTTVQLKSFATSSDTRPELKQLPNGYNLKIAYKTDKDSVVCKFTRTATVPAGSENLMYDLYSPLYTLKAYGPYKKADKEIGFHYSRTAFSTKPINLVPSKLKVSENWKFYFL